MGRHRLDSISDFARRGYNLRFTCQACGHVIDANALEMMSELHRRRLSLEIDAIERRAKCSSCGEKRAKVDVSRCLAQAWPLLVLLFLSLALVRLLVRRPSSAREQ